VAARIIDLSRAAAEALDMIGTGTAPVIVESAVTTSLGPVSPAAVAAPVVAAAPAASAPPVVAASAPPVTATTPQIVIQTPPDVIQTSPVAVQTSPVVAAQPTVTFASVPPPVSYIAPPAVIKGGIPPVGSAKLYRIQVGAFRVPRNAVDVFERLTAAGLNPRYEQYGDLYRVVLPELRAADIPVIAQTLGNTGFQEVLIREE
jgi:rare lipoprotein A